MTISAARRTRWIVLISVPFTTIRRKPSGNEPNESVQTGVSEHNSDVSAPANANVLKELKMKLPIMMINWMIFCGKIVCNSMARSKLWRLVIGAGVLLCSELLAETVVAAAGLTYCVTGVNSRFNGVLCACVA